MEKPNDRMSLNDTIKKTQTENPRILKSAELKMPDKEIDIQQKENASPGSGTCSCNAVCNCVQVNTCSCDTVCTCDSVCSSNSCTCDPFTGCTGHTCSCQPVSSGCGCYTRICICLWT